MLFKQASKLKVRFNTSKGLMATEDLWDLPLTHSCKPNLDDIYKALNKELKNNNEDSIIIIKRKSSDTILSLKFDIVKSIIESKLADTEKRDNAAAVKENNEKILALIASKELGEMQELSIDDLKKMLK